MIIEPNSKPPTVSSDVCQHIPRIVNVCGRTEEAVNSLFDFIETNPQKANEEFLALLSDCMKYKPQIKSAGMPFRGHYLLYYR